MFACRKVITNSVGYGLTLSDHKSASFRTEMMKKAIFKTIRNFSESAFKIPGKSPILQISEDLLFLDWNSDTF